MSLPPRTTDAPEAPERLGDAPRVALVSSVLPTVEKSALLASSKESVAIEILKWAKRRIKIMNNTYSSKQLEELLEAARAAGRAEGYAQARLEMVLERAKTGQDLPMIQETGQDTAARAQKLESLQAQAAKAEEDRPYTTRTTVTMTRTIALDYLKSVAPRVVGPSEIIKNSKKNLGLFISFGTMKRAVEALIESGEVEEIETSRWRYKGRTDSVPLKSVR